MSWHMPNRLFLSVKILVRVRLRPRMVHPTVYLYISNRVGHERRPIKRASSAPPPPFLFLLPTAPSFFSYPPIRFLFLFPTVIFFSSANTCTTPILKSPKQKYPPTLFK